MLFCYDLAMVEAAFDIDARLAADAKLQRLVQALAEDIEPAAILLFGSRARGEERPDSDYDLLVILPDSAPQERMDPLLLYRVARRARVSADVIPCREASFEQSRDLVGTLSYEAAHYGRRIYAAKSASAVAPHGR